MQVLPRADVDVFVLDQRVADICDAASQDWRMSRLGMTIAHGGLDAAMRAYSNRSTPQLLVVEMHEGVNDMLTAVERLASVCDPATNAIIIGAVNDVRLYRTLSQMGVSDYLVAPFDTDDLISSFSRALVSTEMAQGHRLFTVVSGKGGTGATTIAQLAAWSMGERYRETALLLDLCGVMGTAGIAIGGDGRDGVEDYIMSPSRMELEEVRNRIVKLTEHFQVITGGRGIMPSDQFPRDAADALIDLALASAPNVILDVPTGWGSLARQAVARSDEVFVVSTPMLSSLRNTKTVIDEIRDQKGEHADVHLILNRTGEFGKAEVPVSEIERTLQIQPSAQVPFLPEILGAQEFIGDVFKFDRHGEQALAQLDGLVAHLVDATPISRTSAKPAKRGKLDGLRLPVLSKR